MAKLRVVMLGVLSVVMFGCGATSITDAERYEINDRYILESEKYQRQSESCNAAGGIMQHRVWSGTRIPRPLTIHQMRTASCIPTNSYDKM